MDAGGDGGGIAQLLDIVEEHRPEAIRDFREKFGLSVHEIGLSVRYDEAFHLVMTLMRDPSSWLHAAAAEWDYPLGRETIALLDLYDLQHMSKSRRKVRPVPRPWPDKRSKLGGKGKNVRRTAREVLAILRPQS